MVRGTGFFFLVAVAAPAWTPATTTGQLPNCTVDFDVTCPDSAPECGTTFVGGDGCKIIGQEFCYSSGFFSYRVGQGGSLTIMLSDDLNSVSVFFAHQVADGAGTMRFLSATGQQVDEALFTDGPCETGPMPVTQVVFFSRPVRTIEVDNTGDDNIWIDTFEVNPPCNDAGVCDDSNQCTSDTCDAGNCTHTPMDCDDGVACTDDACDAGACVSTPNDSNCPDDGEFCNGVENCDPQLGCVSDAEPCQAGQFCNEAKDTCGECIADGDCDDADASTNDTCVEGTCVSIPSTGDCPADLDGDDDVGASDLAMLLGNWGPNVGHPADLTRDGSVGAEDLAILLGSWGPCPSSESPQCLSDADCDDGVFCNGEEVCDTESSLCIEGSEPCSGLLCAEESASCVECLSDADCDDLLFCNGNETCAESVCQPGMDQCSTNETCNEVDDSCAPADSDQDNQNDDGDDEDATSVDDDSDGVPNDADQCPETASGVSVDSAGCSESQTTGDDDGGMMGDEEKDSNGCGAGSCGAAGGMSFAWILAALSAVRVARRRGGPAGKR